MRKLRGTELKNIIPNKWVGIDYFCAVTGMSRRKVEGLVSLELIERNKCGRNTLVNLEKFNIDLEEGIFEEY